MTPRARPASLLLALAALAGCSQEKSSTVPAPPSTRPVAVTLSVTGAGAAPVHALDVTVALPAGSAVASEAGTGRVVAPALVRRGAAAQAVVEARFVAGATQPTVRVLLASGTALGDGEVLALTVAVKSSSSPGPADFPTSAVTVAGAEGAPVPGAAVAVSGVTAVP